MASLFGCIIGPRLARIYRNAGVENRLYKPNFMEAGGDVVVKTLGVVWKITLYSSPLIVPILYRKNYLTQSKCIWLFKLSLVFGVLFVAAYLIRGFGRYINPDYVNFIVALNNAKSALNRETKRQLSKYDFSFWAWPIEFMASRTEGQEKKLKYSSRHSKRTTLFEGITALPCQLISYAIAHTIGRRLLYPGSLQVFQSAMEQHLTQGRLRLLQELNGERFKLRTADSNDIDCMFVDRRRNAEFVNRETLVICCEGNAGFYEMGIMDTPINAQYSVLGWNHPGFGGSTGEPFPEQEQNAVDVVMQFAIEQLGFKLENIVIYAWSIGGYSATWAAVNYQEVKGLILDATFDDILPLAVSQMPASWKPLVVRTIRDHLNLHNIEQLLHYSGPVLIVRRLKDEVISNGNNLKTNRGNFLFTKLLQTRYPKLFDESTMPLIQRWLISDHNGQILILSSLNIDENFCETLISTCSEEESGAFPSSLGDELDLDNKTRLSLYLASKHLLDFDATHCQPLPGDMFSLPWKPTR